MRWPIFGMLLATLSVSAQQAPTGNVSPAQASAIGKSFAGNLRRSSAPLDNPDALDYVRRVGAKIAAQLPEPHFTYTFSLIGSDACGALHEPCSFPGGYIVVPADFFLAAQDEAEFAGVLAHAMAFAQGSSVPPVVGGWKGFAAPLASSTWLTAAQLEVQRSEERAADLLAVKLASDAGYDPEALVRYFNRVWQDQPPAPGFARYLAAYYDSRDTRVATMQTAIQGLAQSPSASEFLRVQSEVRSQFPK